MGVPQPSAGGGEQHQQKDIEKLNHGVPSFSAS